MTRATIVGAVRTPIGRFLGSLKSLSAVDLGACVVKALVEKYAGIPAAQHRSGNPEHILYPS